MKQEIIDSFLEVRDGRSADVVIADPVLNCRFIETCRKKGLIETAENLNFFLMNLRKSGDLQGIQSASVNMRGQEQFNFASEIAVRFLQRRDNVSLDRILCNPEKAQEFDQLAQDIAPGFLPFNYRWAALSLRKRRRLKPELVSRVAEVESVLRFKVSLLDLKKIPKKQGLYIFHNSSEALYVGETTDLLKRISKHLDHSDNKGLAVWLWEHGTGDLHLEIHVLPVETPTRARRALEVELIQSRKPVFNITGIDT